jgi:Arc/MetJ family transcription regulator
MKTHIEIDDIVLEQICKLGGFTTKKVAVNTALAEYLKLLKRQQLLALRGKVEWQGDLDRLRRNRAEQAE